MTTVPSVLSETNFCRSSSKDLLVQMSSGVSIQVGDPVDGLQQLRDQTESLCFPQQLTTDRQNDRQTEQQTERQLDWMTDRQNDRLNDRQTERQLEWQTDRMTVRQTDTHTHRHTQSVRQTDRTTVSQTHRQTHTHSQTHRQTDRLAGRFVSFIICCGWRVEPWVTSDMKNLQTSILILSSLFPSAYHTSCSISS